jgi:hypothetical protein
MFKREYSQEEFSKLSSSLIAQILASYKAYGFKKIGDKWVIQEPEQDISKPDATKISPKDIGKITVGDAYLKRDAAYKKGYAMMVKLFMGRDCIGEVPFSKIQFAK